MPTLFIYDEPDQVFISESAENAGSVVSGEFEELRIPELAHCDQAEAPKRVFRALLLSLK
ncbi:MAG: hypothetical protein ACK5NT_02440 [Pyrinomonadaceae bacterium]